MEKEAMAFPWVTSPQGVVFHSLEQACLREEGISFPNLSWAGVCPRSCWKKGAELILCWEYSWQHAGSCHVSSARPSPSHSSSRETTGLIRAKSPRAIEHLLCVHPAIPSGVPRTSAKVSVSCWTGTTTCRVIGPRKFCWSELWGPICVSFYCGIKLNELRVIWVCNTTSSFYVTEPFGKKLTSIACLTQLNCTWHRSCQKIHDKANAWGAATASHLSDL